MVKEPVKVTIKELLEKPKEYHGKDVKLENVSVIEKRVHPNHSTIYLILGQTREGGFLDKCSGLAFEQAEMVALFSEEGDVIDIENARFYQTTILGHQNNLQLYRAKNQKFEEI
jgi:hypothetical protein